MITFTSSSRHRLSRKEHKQITVQKESTTAPKSSNWGQGHATPEKHSSHVVFGGWSSAARSKEEESLHKGTLRPGQGEPG